MLEKNLFVLILFASHAFIVIFAEEDGMLCSSHPAYTAGLKGVLMRSWNFKKRRALVTRSAYIPRYTVHGMAPRDDLTSTKYIGLDLFFPAGLNRQNHSDIITVTLQRPGKVYLFVRPKKPKRPGFLDTTLTGWTPEGWAQVVQGAHDTEENLSIMGTINFKPTDYAFVFSKQTSTGNKIYLPGAGYIVNNSNGEETNGGYWVLIAEEDGAASKPPPPPAGVGSIPAGGRCPDELHQFWLAPKRDDETKLFDTTHPLWDPCYFCAYSHEHGSVPNVLMGYSPRLNYLAFKNNNEDESHNGFKGVMMRTGDYLFYYGLHAHLTLSRRFTARFHTAVFVVVNATSKELLMELGHKGDFGFAAVQIKPNGMAPVNEADIAIKAELDAIKSQARRRVNVIFPPEENLNTSYSYKKGNALMRGRYEIWRSKAMCSKGKVTEVDIKNPATALKIAGSDEMTILGPAKNFIVKTQATSTNREFKAKREISFSADHCPFDIDNETGVFYTNPYGNESVDGSDPNAVRQFIKPEFNFTIIGNFQANDTWVGLHLQQKKSKMFDISKAIDPSVN